MNSAQEPSQSPQLSFIEQKSLLLSGLVVLVIAALVGYFYFANRDAGISFGTPTSATGQEIAENASRFLENAHNSSTGTFNLVYSCSNNSRACTPVPPPPQAQTNSLSSSYSAHAILAYRDLFEETGNQMYKQRADKSAEVLREACFAADNIAVCRDGFPVFSTYYGETGDGRYLNAMRRFEQALLVAPFGRAIDFSLGRHLEMLFEATEEKRFRDRLLEHAEQALSGTSGYGGVAYQSEGKPVFANDIRMAWSLYLPAYRITNDSRYLEATEEVLARANLPANLGEFDNTRMSRELVRGLDLLLETAPLSESRRADFAGQARVVAQYIVLARFDNPANPKFNADYGFLQTSATNVTNSKVTDITGWMVRLLIKMPEEEFRLI